MEGQIITGGVIGFMAGMIIVLFSEGSLWSYAAILFCSIMLGMILAFFFMDKDFNEIEVHDK